MDASDLPTRSGPRPDAERIELLDLARGVATLGILAMNALSFAYLDAGYLNVSAAGIASGADVALGLLGEVAFDQKMMGLFSLLFGASTVLFLDRAGRSTDRPGRRALWRAALLFLIGLVHLSLWDGDILTVYAALTPVLLLTGRAPAWVLVLAGSGTMLASAGAGVWVQGLVDPAASKGLGWWRTDQSTVGDAVGLFLAFEGIARALAMMWIGAALFRFGALQGRWNRRSYRRLARFGLGFGLPLAAAAAVLQAASGFSIEVALYAHALNTLATMPLVVGYLGLIALLGGRSVRSRLIAVGRMALTNYLSQTVLGLALLGGLVGATLGPGALPRSGVWGVVLAIWALQLTLSPWWLSRFRYGPVEWAWRVATYRRALPLRR